MGWRSSGLAQSASSFSIYSGTPAAIAPGVSVVGITRSLSAVISARCGGVNTGEEGGPELIGVTCTAAARAIGANRLAPNIAAMPASASLRSIIILPRLRNHGSSRSEEHTSELQSLLRISYAVFCLKK